jgi:hypothetical protein
VGLAAVSVSCLRIRPRTPHARRVGGEIPNEAGRIEVAGDLLAPFNNGWISLDLRHEGVTPIYGDRGAQSWLTVAVDGGSFSTGFEGVQLARLGPLDNTPVNWPRPPGNCWKIIGWLDDMNQPSSGVVGDYANLVPTPCVAPPASGYGWLHPHSDRGRRERRGRVLVPPGEPWAHHGTARAVGSD